MGLSFITEGAIPFGAADPARAIPSFIAGSALTGALVGLAGLKLMAPHGGIFVSRPYIKSTSLHLVCIDRCSRKWYLVRIASQT